MNKAKLIVGTLIVATAGVVTAAVVYGKKVIKHKKYTTSEVKIE